MALNLSTIVNDLAVAFKAIDGMRPQGQSRIRIYQPGIGPLGEDEAVARALHFLQASVTAYEQAAPRKYPGSRQKCDLVIPGEWAIEFKLIRPYGDNGIESEHWSENILHPYPGNTSSIGDCIKLLQSGFPERKAVIVFGYEHSPAQIDLTPAVKAFETIAEQVVGIQFGVKHSVGFGPLIHPIHHHGRMFGWEILGLTSPKLQPPGLSTA